MKKRAEIHLTVGNIKNSHVYLSDHHGMFPADSFGGPNRASGEGKYLKLIVKGLDEVVETDIDGEKMIFRRRDWCERFFKIHGLMAGDSLVIERLKDYEYVVYPKEKAG
jgi:hypothetical protein